MTTQGDATVYPTSPPPSDGYIYVAFPRGITVGPDNALWFTEAGSNEIGRLTTGGAMTEWSLPAPSYWPQPIAVGSDGALWFGTGGDAPQIGRITVGGAITLQALPAGVRANGITAGPDGALWFAGTTSIGRMSTSWQLSQHPLPQGVSGAGQITSGPDGALWFTETCVGTPNEHGGIGRVTTGGAFEEFTGAAIGCPNDIATGVDGALWFVSDHVGRLTTDGEVWSIPLPFSWYGSNKAILQHPDGSVWIANQSGLGRLVVTPVA